MPSTVYKGDISEVTMGHECGIYIQSGEPCTWSIDSTGQDYTILTFAGTSHANNDTIFQNAKPILKIPTGMLVGAKVSFHSHTGTAGNYAAFYYEGANSQVYSIVDHTVTSDATVLSISPKMGSADVGASNTHDTMLIHGTGVPAIDAAFSFDTATDGAAASAESSLTDQFIGLASFMALPDTQVDLKRYHVVGLGRQTSVQQTGKVTHQGGAIEMPLHNPKWLYYCLGREVVDSYGLKANYTSGGTILSGKTISPGQTYVDVTDDDFTTTATISGGVTVGDYIMVQDTTRAPTVYHKHADEGTTDYWPPASGGSLTSDAHHFESTETSEIRRVVAMEALSSTNFRLFVDEPWQFTHVPADNLYALRFDASTSNGSPNVASTGVVTNPVRRLLFSGDTIPSFCLEHSIRTRNVGSHNTETGTSNAPGSSTDSKQLTRIFKGCKITEWELSTTPDDELKFRAIFDALSCYTDTGRLDASNAGDRYKAHRMFENTAETAVKRKESGIAPNSQKPFMFYNGTVEMFDQSIAQISHFELRGKTGVEFFHTIQGNPVAGAVNSDGHTLKQVPHGGTRNPSIVREGREEFEMEVDVIIGDPLLWHELRTSRDFTGTAGNTGGIMNILFTKPTSAAGETQSFRILIDDYIIIEAPIPVPDDKGLLHSKIRVMPKNVKIVSQDTLFHC